MKYSVKSADYLSGDREERLQIVKDLEYGLFKKRELAYGGELKEIKKNLQQPTEVIVDDEDKREIEIIRAVYNFNQQNYFIKGRI